MAKSLGALSLACILAGCASQDMAANPSSSPLRKISSAKLPVICGPEDSRCPVPQSLLWSCDELQDGLTVTVNSSKGGGAAGLLYAAGKYDDVDSQLKCVSKGQTMVCDSIAPGDYSVGSGTVSGKFHVVINRTANGSSASVTGLYGVAAALNWPVGWPLPSDKPVVTKCLDRKGAVKQQVNPRVCKDAQSGSELVSYNSQGKNFNLVGSLDGDANPFSCVAGMIAAGADHEDFTIFRGPTCPLDGAKLYHNGNLELQCDQNHPCAIRNFTCADQRI